MRSELIRCTSTKSGFPCPKKKKIKKPKKYFFVWSTKQINVLSGYLVDMKTANWIFFVIGQISPIGHCHLHSCT